MGHRAPLKGTWKNTSRMCISLLVEHFWGSQIWYVSRGMLVMLKSNHHRLKMSQASPRFLTKWSPWRFPPNHSLYWENGSRGPPFTLTGCTFYPKKYGWMVNWCWVFSDFHGFPPFPHRKSLQNPAWKEAWKLSVSRLVLSPQVNFTVDLLLLVGRNPVPNHRLDAPGTRELTGFPPFKGTFKSMIFQTSLWYVSFLEGIKPCK